MASPVKKIGTYGHIMALFDSDSKCARCREKSIGKDLCVEKKPCEICESFSEDQKKQLAPHPTYRARKELQKKASSPPPPPPPKLLILLTLLCWDRLRARVTLVIEATPLLRSLKSPLTSPLLRRKPAKPQISRLNLNLWMTSGRVFCPLRSYVPGQKLSSIGGTGPEVRSDGY